MYCIFILLNTLIDEKLGDKENATTAIIIYELLKYRVVFIGQQLFIETCLQSKAVCGSLTEPVDQPPGI